MAVAVALAAATPAVCSTPRLPLWSITLTPTAASVYVGTGQAPFSATVTNTQDPTVSWSVNGVIGGNDTVGVISTNGIYAAPASSAAHRR